MFESTGLKVPGLLHFQLEVNPIELEIAALVSSETEYVAMWPSEGMVRSPIRSDT